MNPQDDSTSAAEEKRPFVADVWITTAKLCFPFLFLLVGLPMLLVVVCFRVGFHLPLNLLKAAGLRRPLLKYGLLPDDM
jgi:hypothetical protein